MRVFPCMFCKCRIPGLAKAATDFGHCTELLKRNRPWGSQKVAKKGTLNTELGSLPAVGCSGLA